MYFIFNEIRATLDFEQASFRKGYSIRITSMSSIK